MRTQLKIVATLSVCAVFYAGAYFMMEGVKEFEKRGNEALFTSKTEMAAIDSAEVYQAEPVPQTSLGIWK